MQYYFQFPVRGISHSRPLPSGVPARTSSLKFWREGTDSNRRLSFVQCRVATARHVSRERSNRLSYPLIVFRLPFVKERRYYRIHHWESQWQKNTPCRLWSAGCSAVAELVGIPPDHSEISWSSLLRWPPKMSLSARWLRSSSCGAESVRCRNRHSSLRPHC